MVRAIDHSDYGYGTLGECLDVLLYEDPNIVKKLHLAITLLLLPGPRVASQPQPRRPSQGALIEGEYRRSR